MKNKLFIIVSAILLVSLFSIMSVFAYTTADCSATGGDMSVVGNYCIHVFYSDGTFIPSDTLNASVLVVAGGGGGGGSTNSASGGGGAGGLIYNTSYIVNGSVDVVVGLGGNGGVGGDGVNGGNSTYGTLNAMGGGGGGGILFAAGNNGGSGGGAGETYPPACNGGTGFSGQGNNAGCQYDASASAGGGGSNENGGSTNHSGVGGKGGNGILINITGTPTYYAGGGGGGGISNGGNGGLGGGGEAGNRSVDPTANLFNGQNGTGGGGGGSETRSGGLGGSGIVIVSYKIIEVVNETIVPTFNVSLNSPTPNQILTDTSVLFDCSMEDSPNMLNLTLIVDNSPQFTIYNTTGNQTDMQLTHGVIFSDNSTHNWTCKGFSKTWNNTATQQSFSIQVPVIPPTPTPSLTSNTIYDVMNTFGAGLGLFFQIIAPVLFEFFIIFVIVGLVVGVGYALANIFKSKTFIHR